jgi:hypothetical protein
MLNQLIVGNPSKFQDTTVQVARGGQQGEQIVTELHGRYYEQTVRGNMFSVETQGTSVTTTAALATTFTGLAVGNPAGSGVNLVLNKFTAAQLAVGAAGQIGIMGGAGSITASLTPQSRLIGSGLVSKATATAGQTISTPVLIGTFGQVGSLATTGYGLTPGIYVDMEGSIIVPPGSFIASYTAVVTTSALQFSFCWEETPLLA